MTSKLVPKKLKIPRGVQNTEFCWTQVKVPPENLQRNNIEICGSRTLKSMVLLFTILQFLWPKWKKLDPPDPPGWWTPLLVTVQHGSYKSSCMVNGYLSSTTRCTQLRIQNFGAQITNYKESSDSSMQCQLVFYMTRLQWKFAHTIHTYRTVTPGGGGAGFSPQKEFFSRSLVFFQYSTKKPRKKTQNDSKITN